MRTVFSQIVDKQFAGKTVKEFLAQKMLLSASLIKKAKQTENGILVNGEHKFVTHTLLEGDKVEVLIETENERSQNIPSCEIPLDKVYEDEHILIVDKSGNLPTHPSLNNYEKSLAGAVMNYFDKQGLNFVFRAVNRLDKGTSGLMIIAKNAHIHELFKLQLHTNEFVREYKALASGKIERDCTIDAPIMREKESIIKRIVHPSGEKAVTHLTVQKVFEDKTLIKLRLETGRTHQIRVHLSHIGHALVGDFLYGEETDEISRPALHSQRIEFIHPITREKMVFESDLPKDILNLTN